MADRKLTQTESDTLARSCIVYAALNGKVEKKEDSPVHSAQRIRFDGKEFSVKATVFSHAMGNGGFTVTVRQGKKAVFVASGKFTVGPFDARVQTYEPGSWAKEIKAFAKSVANSERR